MMFEAMVFKFKTIHIKHQTFNFKRKKRLSHMRQPLFLFPASSDAVVEVGDESVDVDAVGTSALADGFEVSSHAANAAETVLLEDFNDLRIFLNGFNDTRVFCNLCHYVYSSL